MNHWETFKIMRQACTREGVVAVAAKNQTLKPFVDAAAADVALLTSRLEVLDPGQIKAYFGKSAAELEMLRHNLVAKAEAKRVVSFALVAKAEAKAAAGSTFLKDEKQAVLARVRELAGWERLDIDAEVYRDFSGNTRLAPHVNALYNTYIASLAPPHLSSIPWASLRLSTGAPLAPVAALPAAARPAAVAPTTAAAAAAQPAAVAPITAAAAAAQPAAVAPTTAAAAAAQPAAAAPTTAAATQPAAVEVGRPQRKKRKTSMAAAAATQAVEVRCR